MGTGRRYFCSNYSNTTFTSGLSRMPLPPPCDMFPSSTRLCARADRHSPLGAAVHALIASPRVFSSPPLRPFCPPLLDTVQLHLLAGSVGSLVGFAEDLGHRSWELAIDSTGLLVGFAGPRSFYCRCGRGSQLTSFFWGGV